MTEQMTELEGRLESPEGGALSEELLVKLGCIAERLRLQISRGLPRSEFDDWQAAADAVAVARDVLQTWARGENDVGRKF